MPTASRRLLAALTIAAVVAAITWAGHAPPAAPSDWDQIWIACRALLDGSDPYAAVAAAWHAGRLEYPLYYPGTAVIVAAPFALFDLRVASTLWNACGAGLLAYAIADRGWWGLLIFLSSPAIAAILQSQWSLFMVAATILPALGFIWAAKPPIGLVLFAGWPSRLAVLGMATLGLLSFVVLPHWPATWLATLRQGGQRFTPPLWRPGGVVLLLAALRWRQPEARALLVLSVVPHTVVHYETLALFLIPRTRRQMAVLVVLSLVEYALVWGPFRFHPNTDLAGTLAAQWPLLFALIYLPALWFVLIHRTTS